jgi:hypothetical protein
MELHRLDGMDAAGLDSIDITEVEYDYTGGLNGAQIEALEALGYVQNPEIAYEIQDEEGNVVMYADAEENLYMVDGLGELGFLKKIGKGLKNAAKFVGKKVIKPVAKGVSNAAKFTGKKILKPVISTVNRYVNPATILLRNGFLASMKLDLFNVAERLRFGYLSDAEARKRGVNMSEFSKLKKAIHKANQIYELAGGKKENLKNAILKGKGNSDKAVPLSGLEGLGEITEYADEFERFILESDPDLVEEYIDGEVEGLGIVASTAIAAASAAVGSVAALLSKITGVFDKAKNAKEQVQSLVSIPKKPSAPTPSAPRVTLPVAKSYTAPAPKVVQPVRQSYTAPIRTSSTLQVRPSTVMQTIVPQPLQRLTNDPTTIALPPQRPTSPSTAEEQSWLQKNKTSLIVGAGVAVAAGGILYAVKQSKSKKNKPVSGIPANKKEKRKSKTGTAKQTSKVSNPSSNATAKRAKASKKSSKRKQGRKHDRLAPKVLL